MVERVVVKVKYPSAETLLRGDVRTIKAFAKVAQPVHVPALEQIEAQFMEEFDYRDEARHLAAVRENLIKAGLAADDAETNRKLCLVPKPYLQLCTQSVLVMEELFGDKLADALKQERKALADSMGESVEEFAKRVKAEEQKAKAMGEELKGPSSSDYELLISVLDGKRKTSNALKMVYNSTIGWLPGMTKKEYEDRRVLPINHAKMIDDLIYIHGHEVLVDGYFNAGEFSHFLVGFASLPISRTNQVWPCETTLWRSSSRKVRLDGGVPESSLLLSVSPLASPMLIWQHSSGSK
jgi:aarF domain-containing kinase